MPKKKGPPYSEEDLDCKYIVIENPWPAGISGPSGAARTQEFYNQVGAWLRYALNKAEYPETIYSRQQRSDIIVKFAEHVDTKPLLGAHHWPHFLKGAVRNQDISYIFEFNYRRHGHPETHNWTINELDARDPPSWRGKVPFKHPYPLPVWADVRAQGLACKEFALSIPEPQEEPEPEPEPPEPARPQVNTRSASAQKQLAIDESSIYSFANAMRDRLPKTEENENANLSHSQTRRATAEPLSSRAALPSRSPTLDTVAEPSQRLSTVDLPSRNKADPYEQDVAATRALRAETRGAHTPLRDVRVKQETTIETGPDPELLAAFNALQEQRASTKVATTPSMSAHQSNTHNGATDRSSGEPRIPRLKDEDPSPSLQAAFRELQESRVRGSTKVKPEPFERSYSSQPATFLRSATIHDTSSGLASYKASNSTHLPPQHYSSESSTSSHFNRSDDLLVGGPFGNSTTSSMTHREYARGESSPKFPGSLPNHPGPRDPRRREHEGSIKRESGDTWDTATKRQRRDSTR